MTLHPFTRKQCLHSGANQVWTVMVALLSIVLGECIVSVLKSNVLSAIKKKHCTFPGYQVYPWNGDLCGSDKPYILASFPGSSAPERDIEVVHAARAWYSFSREKRQR